MNNVIEKGISYSEQELLQKKVRIAAIAENKLAKLKKENDVETDDENDVETDEDIIEKEVKPNKKSAKSKKK